MSRRVALALSPVKPLVQPINCQPLRAGTMMGVIGLCTRLFEFYVVRVQCNSSFSDAIGSHSSPAQHVQGRATHRIQLDDVQMPREIADNLSNTPVELWLPGGFSVIYVPAAMLTKRHSELSPWGGAVSYFQQLDLLALNLECVDGFPSRQCPRPAAITPGRSHLAPDRSRPVVTGPRPFHPGRRRVIVCSATALPSPGDRGLGDSGR